MNSVHNLRFFIILIVANVLIIKLVFLMYISVDVGDLLLVCIIIVNIMPSSVTIPG